MYPIGMAIECRMKLEKEVSNKRVQHTYNKLQYIQKKPKQNRPTKHMFSSAYKT